MKRAILFIVFIFLGLSLQAQAPYTFNKTKYYWEDSTYMLNTARSLARSDSVLYLAVGNKNANTNLQRTTVVKTDLQGNVINKRELGSDQFNSSFYPSGIIDVDRDTNILVACYTLDATRPCDGFLVKLDRNLDTLWLKYYDLPASAVGIPSGLNPANVFHSVIQTFDGGYLVSGKYYKDTVSAPTSYGYLLKLDSAGNKIWQKLYNGQIGDIHEVVQTPDSGFVFADFGNMFRLNKTDQYGNIVWQRKNWAGQGNLKWAEVALMNNQYVISISPYVYKHLSLYTDYHALQVVKYDLQGNLQFDKQFRLHKNFTDPGISQGYGLETNGKGEIFIAGTSRAYYDFAPNKGNYKGVMLKLNSQGDSLWSRFYSTKGLSDICQFNDLILMDDGGFMACGHHQPYPFNYNWGAWLVRMDSMGMAPGAYTVDVENPAKKQKKSQIHLYPNPAREQVTFDLSDLPQPESYQLCLYNMTGKKVKNLRIEKTRKKVNIEGLEPGAYLYRIKAKTNTRTYQGKFMKVE